MAKTYLTTCLAAFLISFSATAKGKNDKELMAKIDSVISQYEFNGVILLSQGSKDVYHKAIGFSDVDNKVKLRQRDQFVIGSISKQITAVLLMREYEKGRVALDDTIGQYLKDIKQPWVNKVTIHHLLTHTHGIAALDKPLEFEPDSEFYYSQLGYDLIAQILQKVTGQSFESLSTSLFEQYGLADTYHPDNKNYQRLVKGYQKSEVTVKHVTNSLRNYAAAGSFISSAKDLKKWNELLYSGQLVTPETLELMKTRYATRVHPIFDTVEYGYGLLFKDGEQNVQIGALGYAPGFVSACYYYPQSDMSLVILANMVFGLPDFDRVFKVHTDIMELVKNQR